jgi:predicted lipid-binding transport protein (Tim44 family)
MQLSVHHLSGVIMKKFFGIVAATVLAFSLTALDADAKRLGGGSSIGKQRATPAVQQQTQKTPTQAAPAQTTAPIAGAAAAPLAKPSFMQKWGGMIAGIGMGALLGSMLGSNFAGLGGILNILLIAAALFVAYKFFAGRRAASAAGAGNGMQYAGAGAPVSQPQTTPVNFGGSAAATPMEVDTRNIPADFQIEPFVRQAKSAFIRMQAANDAKDLNDLRDFTTPEVYAELSLQMQERGEAKQKTDIVTLNADLIEVVTEADVAIASVRYNGLIRETGEQATPFDEIWHVQKNLKDAKATWLVAGIQQVN